MFPLCIKPSIYLAIVHSCALIQSTLLNITVTSLHHPLVCGKNTLLIELSPSIASFLHPVPRHWSIAFNIFPVSLN